MKTDLPLESLIRTIRGQKVRLDTDLAAIYGVPTKALNQAVKRNSERFPEDFLFQLSSEDARDVVFSRSQTVTLKRGQNISNTSPTLSPSTAHSWPRMSSTARRR